MRKIYLLALGLLFCQIILAQNVNLEVRITKLERTNYGDCGGCGDEDPVWKVSGTHNGVGAVSYGPICTWYEDLNTPIYDITDYTLFSITNSTATTFTLGLEAYEKNCSNNYCTYQTYNFFTCFPSVYGDSRYVNNSTLKIENFRTFAPCQWHDGFTAFLGDYKVYYSFQWTYSIAPTVALQPVPVTNNCLSTPALLNVRANNDANGWNMGLNFQWQVSTATACPGSNWVDIVASNNDTFVPPIIGGTRLYRCKITSNCSANFNSNTVITNCAQVTYNPIGAPGDPAPAIVSGICGSTVLPGSTHTLGVVSAPTIGAVTGIAGYTWNAAAGAPLTATGNTFNWTAPSTPGAYNITLTYNDNCAQADAVAPTCVVNVGSPLCDFAYVSPSGQDSVYRGGPDNPYKTLGYAISQLGSRRNIRMAHGTYVELNPLPLVSNLIIDGGYTVSSNIWIKSNIDSTVLDCRGTQVVNGDIAHRVGFIADNDDNWVLQDLKIVTQNIASTTTNNKGYSNYGILAINGSSGFKINRCSVYAGSAANGVNGTTPSGAGGAGGGGNGGNGGGGSTTGCNGSGSNGSGGASGNGGAGGGGGGNSGAGSGCNIFGCNASGANGGSGVVGNNGAIGLTNFAAGNRPTTPTANTTYYTPAGQSATGSNGFGGGGGGGGGGGDIGTCCSCGCGSGAPNGGNGGNGGGGGLPGSGGFGGGGSFAVYVSGAGSSGTINTSLFLAGNAGTGGNGALGQAGANGAGGAAGFNHGGCDGGAGGNGGNGGRGGDGGRGQDGANGLSSAIQTDGIATISGVSTAVPNAQIVTLNTQNTKFCINSEIEMTKSAGTWTLPVGLAIINNQRDLPAGMPSSSYTNSSSPIFVSANTPNTAYDLTISGTVYKEYVKVAADNRVLPTINLSAHQVCQDGSVSMSASVWGTQVEYDWKIYQGTNVNSPVFQSTLPSDMANLSGLLPGLYVIKYRVKESCCGWSKPVYDSLRILPPPVQFIVGGGGNYCPGGNGVAVTLSNSESGVKYYLIYNGNAVDSITSTGGPLTFANQTAIGSYTVLAVRIVGCDMPMFGSTYIGLYPEPTQYHVTGGGKVCSSGGNGTKDVFLNGSQIGVNYQLFLNGIVPLGLPVPGTGNQLSFGPQSINGFYTVIGTFQLSGCQKTMLDTAFIETVSPPTAYPVLGGGAYCIGDTGKSIYLSITDTATIYNLVFAGNVIAGPIAGNGSAINFGTYLQPGIYSVSAISNFGCSSQMANTVTIKQLSNPVVTNVLKTNPTCHNNNTGTIKVNGTSFNGGLTYSIDSGQNYQSGSLFSSLSAGYYYIYIKDDSSCVAGYAANALQLIAPDSILVTTANIINNKCKGDSTGKIDISVTGGTAPYSFLWSNGGTFEDAVNLPGGSFTVTVTDHNSCTSTYTNSITEPALVLTASLAATNVKCFNGNDGSLMSSVSGGTASYSYYWNTGDTTTNLANATAGNFSLQVTDKNGCKANAFATITQPTALTVSGNVNNPLCGNSGGGSIKITANGGVSPYTYSWSNLANTDSISNLTSGNYTVTVRDANLCSVVATYTVIVPDTIFITTANFTYNLCKGDSSGNIDITINGGTTPYSFAWSNGNTFEDALNLVGGIYSVTVIDRNGCSSTHTQSITEPSAVLSATLSGTNVKCYNGNDGSLTSTVSGGTAPYSYYWNTGDTTTNLANATAGNFSLQVTDKNGCKANAFATITQPTALTISGNVNSPLCGNSGGGSIKITANGGVSPYTYSWSNLANTDSISNLTSGNYTVTVRDANLCSVVATYSVVAPDSFYVVLSGNSPTCAGNSTGFALADGIGGSAPYTYLWSTSPTQSSSLAGNLAAGNYTVTATDKNGCTTTATVAITSPPVISVTTVPVNVTCFSGSDGTVTVNASGGVGGFTYSLNGVYSPNNIFTNLSAGNYIVVVEDQNGCKGNATFMLTAPAQFSVDAGTDQYVLANEPVTLKATASSTNGIVSYEWKPAAYITCSTCDSTSAAVPQTTAFVVYVTDGQGCVGFDTVLVEISSDFKYYIPSAFTPNGDGLNDVFQMNVLGAKTLDVKIWNRWGELIFANSDYPNEGSTIGAWDGKFRGQEVQLESYTYSVDITMFDGVKRKLNGTVTIMK